jgi:hypothetical protein
MQKEKRSPTSIQYILTVIKLSSATFGKTLVTKLIKLALTLRLEQTSIILADIHDLSFGKQSAQSSFCETRVLWIRAANRSKGEVSM